MALVGWQTFSLSSTARCSHVQSFVPNFHPQCCRWSSLRVPSLLPTPALKCETWSQQPLWSVAGGHHLLPVVQQNMLISTSCVSNAPCSKATINVSGPVIVVDPTAAEEAASVSECALWFDCHRLSRSFSCLTTFSILIDDSPNPTAHYRLRL